MAESWRERRAWATRASHAPRNVALVQETDPQHSDPDPNTYMVTWVSEDLAPVLPIEMMGDQLMQPPVPGGPIDHEPQSHEYGVGAGPGLTEGQSRAEMEPWHETDTGSVEARQWNRAVARDGRYHVDIIDDEIGNGSSPETVTIREVTGVGAANDPYARRGKRIWRWRDRIIDRHMWGVEQRPVFVRNAFTAPELAGGSGPYVSPYPTGGWSGRHGIGTPDQLVMGQRRTTPRPWDEDRTADPDAGMTADQGLTVWGL